MLTIQKRLSLYVDRATRQWVVLDPEGNFWIIPSVGNPWDERQSFEPTAETDLEPIPGHYKHMLDLPF